MKNHSSTLGILLGIMAGPCANIGLATDEAARPDPTAVKAITQKVADWQIETFEDQGKYRAHGSSDPTRVPSKHHEADWANAAFYSGLNEWCQIADNPEKYTDWLKMIAERNEWRLQGADIYNNVYHADTHLIGLIYLSLYETFRDPDMLAPTQSMFDFIIENPSQASLEYVPRNDRPKDAQHFLHRWGWCDALYMAPPVWAKLAKITGDREYLEFMHAEYRATYDLLWDEAKGFFYRDTRFFTRFEENEEPVFWARGNGWVFGGLALMIPDLPTDWEGRGFYLDLFKTMAVSIQEAQRADGTWSMGLLGEASDYPFVETSGTAFLTFGLAWGVNQGLLNRERYEPVIFKAWHALTENVTDAGMLTHVQPIGSAPGDVFADKTEVYGTGAFLAAGSEVYKLVGGNVP